jgi:PAS domain S-box-containing protein
MDPIANPPSPRDSLLSDDGERLRFEQLFAEAPTFMAVLAGPEHRFEFVNPGYARLVGNRSVVGRTLAEALPHVVPQGYLEILDQVYAGGRAYTASGARYTADEADGSTTERFVDFVYQPMKDAAGKVRGIFVVGVDVTDRVVAERRRDALMQLTDAFRYLRKQEDITFKAAEILGETLNVSRVGYGTIQALSETLHVDRDWNAPGVQSLAGSLQLRDYGSFIDDLKLGNLIAIGDVDKDPRTAMAAEALKARSAGAFVNVPVVESGVLVAVLYVNNARARLWSAEDLAFIKEIAERTRTVSERVRGELALRDSEAKFRTIAEAMPQMIWSTLPDGSHDYYNRQWYEFTGVPEGSTDGDGWANMFHPDDQERTWAAWKHSLATGAPYEVQYRLRHHSGEYRWTLGRALPIRDEAGNIVRWMGTCTDIHAHKIAEEELREASRRKDEFLAMLAHELRNPLAPISSAAELLKLGKSDPARIARAADVIQRQVQHMTTLVDDLLDVSRVSRGLVELEKEPVDIKHTVNLAIEQARPLIEQRKHTLHVNLEPEDAFVRGDRTRLVQVIANLLNNAAKYTQQGGDIALGVSVRQARVHISVKDNGSGIAPSLLPHVFDLFTQAERTPDRAQGGLGLGLALVKSITAMHDGEVNAESAGLGLGSTFTISLPLYSGEAAGIGAPLHSMSEHVQPLRLMIVDDNVDAASSLASLLEQKGHHVTVHDDASGALTSAAEQAPDVFILDIGLPGMDGYELTRRLRADPATRNALFIALTGYGQEHDRVLSRAAGFDHHFIKPLDIRQLEQLLGRVTKS